MYLEELGGNSCSSILIQGILEIDLTVWDAKKRKYAPRPIDEAFWEAFKEVCEGAVEDEDLVEIHEYAFFVVYMTDTQVGVIGDFLLSIGFERTPSEKAVKTGNKCSLWYAPVRVVLGAQEKFFDTKKAKEA